MNINFNVPFKCDEGIRPHLQKVFLGEYDVEGLIFAGGCKILDLGANCGAFALWALHRWPGSEIICYEPHPDTFETLKENTQHYGQIQINNFGLGSPGMRVLLNGFFNSGEASFHKITPSTTGQHLEVKDPRCLPEADVIKLDIEGCEMEVLGPIIKEGRKFKLILLEYHNDDLRREVDQLLKDYILVDSEVSALGRGTVKYMHRDLIV